VERGTEHNRGGGRKGNIGSRKNWRDLDGEIIKWNILSREQGKIGSRSCKN